jgi:O-antigen ligase
VENVVKELLAPVAVWVIMAVILAASFTSMIAAAAAVGLLVLILGWSLFGSERFGGALFCVGVCLSPATRVTVPGASFATVSDVFFLLGFVVLAPVLLTRPFRLPWIFVVGSMFFVASGVMSGVIGGAPTGTNLSVMIRIAAAMILLPIATAWWAPSRQWLIALAASYLVGIQISMVAGLIDGPVAGTGRVIGLAEQPTGHGYAAILGACLIPFLWAIVERNWRPWLILGGMGCLYTIWVSGSRASLLVGAAIAIIFPLLERSLKAAGALGAGAVAALVSFNWLTSGPNEHSALGRLLGGSGAGGSTEQRLDNAMEALGTYARNPWFGTGWRSDTWLAHNMYAQVGEAMGTVGLIAFLVLLVGYSAPFISTPRPHRFLVYPAVAFIVAGPITPNLNSRFVGVLVGLGVTAIASLARERAELDEQPEQPDQSEESPLAARERLNA